MKLRFIRGDTRVLVERNVAGWRWLSLTDPGEKLSELELGVCFGDEERSLGGGLWRGAALKKLRRGKGEGTAPPAGIAKKSPKKHPQRQPPPKCRLTWDDPGVLVERNVA